MIEMNTIIIETIIEIVTLVTSLIQMTYLVLITQITSLMIILLITLAILISLMILEVISEVGVDHKMIFDLLFPFLVLDEMTLIHSLII